MPAFIEQFNFNISSFGIKNSILSLTYSQFAYILEEKIKDNSESESIFKKSVMFSKDIFDNLYEHEEELEEEYKSLKQEEEFLLFIQKNGLYIPGKAISNNTRGGEIKFLDTLSEKLKDLKQPKMPSSLYTIKYNEQ